MSRRRFSGSEDTALLNILEGRPTNQIRWAHVVAKLRELGYPERTEKSVRNRHLRRRTAQRAEAQGIKSINFCRKCGRLQRGHACVVLDAPAEDEGEGEGEGEVASGGEKE